ncbi:MAG: hypothetical protein CVV51_03315 [Spirochaetae bacterium HGW-Spirochaetae-7]|nr:MAG: hypothetical protein CVV51_03315 [Spirochaetae bacterium HGW-Spirochaetae-7]
MDALRDQSWMRELYLSSPVERFDWRNFSVVSSAAEPNDGHHNNRYRFRLFFFEQRRRSPVMAVNMESDLLGTWSLTVTTASGTAIQASFDVALDYETFKAMALEAAARQDLGPEPAKPARRRRAPDKRRIP